jgi:hypothetical protein
MFDECRLQARTALAHSQVTHTTQAMQVQMQAQVQVQ